MNRRLPHLLPLILAGYSAAALADPLEYVPGRCTTPGVTNNLYCGLREPTRTFADACPDNRWIGFFLTAGAPPACPAPAAASGGSWSVQRLFPTRAGIQPPNDLRAFCLYEWAPIGQAQPAVTALPNQANFRVQRDCRVVSPLYVPNPAVTDLAQATYDAQANLPLFNGPVALPSPVRVAIVDNVPDEIVSGQPSGPPGSHGYSMGALVRHNSCFRTPLGVELGCAAHVVSYQGLPLAPQGGEGGYGTQATVAQAIVRAVQDFKAQNAQARLIINLSLGWDGRYGALEGPGIRTGALATWMAIQWAACEGALVLAASGNRSDLGAVIGPMFPAGWEMDQRLCQANAGAYGPPVQAVGGVDEIDQPLLISRPDAQPRIVAPATFVSVWRPTISGPQASAWLTGTSLAAAGVSGTAAMVWALAPTERATDIADHLQATAVSVSGADFANPDAFQDSRRLDACLAVATTPGAPAPVPCPYRPPFTGLYPLPYFEAAEAQWPGIHGAPATPGSSAVEVLAPAPSLDPYVSPWVTGQPGKDTCPYCEHQAEMLTGKIDLSGNPIKKVIYQVACLDCPDGVAEMSFEITADFSKDFHVQLPLEAGQVAGGSLKVEAKGPANATVSTLSKVNLVY